MVKKRTKVIGTAFTSTLFLLLAWFAGSPQFDLEVGPDTFCEGTVEDPCIGYFNVTSLNKTFYFYNKNRSNDLLVEFDKEVKQSQLCIDDGRCKACGMCPAGYRPINLNESFSKYSYVLKLNKGVKRKFAVVAYKHDPLDSVEWFINDIGPMWDPRTKELCREEVIDTIPVYVSKKVLVDGQECSDPPQNRTCKIKKVPVIQKEISHYENVTACRRYGVRINNKTIVEQGIHCNYCGETYACWKTSDGAADYERLASRKGAFRCGCDSGESCVEYNTSTDKISRVEGKGVSI